MEFQEAFEKAGTLGRAQLLIIVMVFVAYIFAGWQAVTPVFTGIEVPFYCSDNKSILSNQSFDKKCIEDCQLYVYKQDVKSTVAEFDLSCGSNQVMSSLSNSVFWFANMISLILSGRASDRFGRKTIFLICCPLFAAFSATTAFAPNIWFYTCFRFLNGLFYGGFCGPIYILMAETVKKEYLAQLSMGAMVIYAIGEIIGAVIGYLFRSSWRLQIMIMSAVPVPIWFIFAVFIPESPMWLNSRKRFREAEKVLCLIAERNGNDPSTIRLSANGSAKSEKTETSTGMVLSMKSPEPLDDLEIKKRPGSKLDDTASILDLFRTFPAFMLSGGQICSWFTVSLVYFGLTFGVGGISGSPYINSILLAICEFPVWLVAFAMDKYGRKVAFYVCLLLSSAACFTLPFTAPIAGGVFQIAFAMVGKGMVTAAFDLLFTYTPELYPTVLRGTGLLLCSSAASSATILAPFVTYIDVGPYNCAPYLIFAVFGVVSSLFIMIYGLETLGKPLLNTKEEFFIAARTREIKGEENSFSSGEEIREPFL